MKIKVYNLLGFSKLISIYKDPNCKLKAMSVEQLSSSESVTSGTSVFEHLDGIGFNYYLKIKNLETSEESSCLSGGEIEITPVEINNIDNLMALDPYKNYILNTNIDLSGVSSSSWTGLDDDKGFYGTFNGNGKKIYGLNVK